MEGVGECLNSANHQAFWSIIPLRDFYDPSCDLFHYTSVAVSSPPTSSPPVDHTSANNCDTYNLSILPPASRVQNKQPVTGTQPPSTLHEYANFEMCPRANTLPWKRGGCASALSTSANSAWTMSKRQTVQQTQQQLRILSSGLRSDYPDGRKLSQTQVPSNSCTVS